MFLQGPNFTWDYKYLMRSIATSPDIQVEGVVIRRPARGETRRARRRRVRPGPVQRLHPQRPARRLPDPAPAEAPGRRRREGGGPDHARAAAPASGRAAGPGPQLADVLPVDIHPGDGQIEPEGGIKFVPKHHGPRRATSSRSAPSRAETGQALGHAAAAPGHQPLRRAQERGRDPGPDARGPTPSR